MSRKSFFNKITTPKKTISKKKTPKKTAFIKQTNIKQAPQPTNWLDKIFKLCLKILIFLPLMFLLSGLWWVLFKFFPEVYSTISGKFQEIGKIVKLGWEKIKSFYAWLGQKGNNAANFFGWKPPKTATSMLTVLMGTVGTGTLIHVLKKTMTRNLVLKLGIGGLKLVSRCYFWGSLAYLGWELYQLKDQKPTPTTPTTPLQEQVTQTTPQTTPTKNLLQQFQDDQKKNLSP